MDSINLLALSGSLRQSSYNTAAITALKFIAPQHIDITIGNIGSLPLFNPDREDECIPAVESLKHSLAESDGLIIASPEYAHGISGPLKNALNWLVSGVEFPFKPIMLINTSPRASHAQDSLREILMTMSGIIVEKSCMSIPLLGSELDANGIIDNPDICLELLSGLENFHTHVRKVKIDR